MPTLLSRTHHGLLHPTRLTKAEVEDYIARNSRSNLQTARQTVAPTITTPIPHASPQTIGVFKRVLKYLKLIK